jgi:hypothetical protein
MNLKDVTPGWCIKFAERQLLLLVPHSDDDREGHSDDDGFERSTDPNQNNDFIEQTQLGKLRKSPRRQP